MRGRREGMYYVGHTDELDLRIAQHQSGALKGHTSRRLPVTLVWSERFQARDEAKAVERKLKGWSRAKKEAMIAGDWLWSRSWRGIGVERERRLAAFDKLRLGGGG